MNHDTSGAHAGRLENDDAHDAHDAHDALAQAQEAAVRAEQRLTEALDVLPQGIVFLDADGRYLLWNQQYAEIYHNSADLFAPGARLVDTLRLGVARGDYPEAAGREEEWLAERCAMLENPSGRHEQWLADGRCIMIEERKTSDGGTIGLRVDITEMKQREESFRLLFESNPVPLLVYDPATETIRSANLAAAEHFGHPVTTFAGMSAADLFDPADWSDARRLLASSQSEKDSFWRQRRSDGSELESVLFTRQSVIDGKLAAIISVFDVTERRKAEARIAHMARHDELTGLANRAHCRERLQDMLESSRKTGHEVGIAMIDLDNFKSINDSHGHSIGDALLAQAARRMKALVPKKNALLCRIGGDEFALIVQARTREQIHIIARSIVSALSEPFSLPDYTLHIGATIGVAIGPNDSEDVADLFRFADLALYSAKEEQRGTVRSFEPHMDIAAQEKSRLENDLRRAVREGQLKVYYQPQIDLASGRVNGHEALLRWDHPERGLLYPDSFIPLAEEMGLIDVIGQYVLQVACRDAVAWPDDVRLAVNASPLQFRGGNLVNVILQALVSSGLAPDRLEMEITEAVLLDRKPQVAAQLQSIRALGVGISMDDFGTGYSSLSYLLSYPFTKIKIDRSFITGLSREPNSMAVVNAIIGLGRSLNLTVTAEGIEEQEDLAFLRDIGCGQGQGYLFGRAVPVDQCCEAPPQRDVA